MGIKEFYSDDWLTVYHGDAATVLATLPAESVHCVVTSPPYWGLRDYGTASWSGGDDGCPHRVPATGSTQNKGNNNREGKPFAETCALCGAVREDGQLGLEATPEAYVANMVAVFREVRRVLRSDGTVWLNLGDSYAAQRGGTTMPAETLAGGDGGWMPDGSRVNRDRHDGYSPSRNASAIGLKHKDLVGIPWRVAFALRADGWYLRSDIIWAKPNPMPESVTDRPTKAHEYLFLLSKSPRYYFDADAVRTITDNEMTPEEYERNLVNWQPPRTNGDGVLVGYAGEGKTDGGHSHPAGRNIRSVWTIATQPYRGAHFAVFPEALVEPCVKAGTSERGVCPECGAPWQRIVERVTSWAARKAAGGTAGNVSVSETYQNGVHGVGVSHDLDALSVTTTGWRPSCSHDTEPVPATVLDPFAGSGTTGLVAQRLSRRAVLIDLSMDYLGQLMDRNRDIPLGLGA